MKYVIGSFEHFRALVSTALMGARTGAVKGLGALDGTGIGWAQEARAALDQHAAAERAGLTEVPAANAWPRLCPTCGRTFTAQQWACLDLFGYVGAFKADGVHHAVQLRRCVCTELIGVEVPLPMAAEAPATLKPIFEGRCNECRKPLVDGFCREHRGPELDALVKLHNSNVMAAVNAPLESLPYVVPSEGATMQLSKLGQSTLDALRHRHGRPEDHAQRCTLDFNHAGECEPWPF